MDPVKALQTLPGVGPKLARVLFDLGYRDVDGLCGEDPESMYRRLCALRGEHVDRCVLYVFRCAVYSAGHEEHDPELLKWWNWKDSRPAGSP
ncbi:MAG: helix-hairpin-helix domain-containing protein [Desulfobacteraceae bacterium]|jgi:hypothetical protein